jgi:UDP-glucose 4-epimerase
LATEAYALAYQASYGFKVLAFRFFNVFGPLQPADHAYAAVVPAFVSRALKGEALTIYGDGTQSRDFTFVDTVGSVILDAVAGGVSAAGPVNLAFGSRIDLLGLVELLEKILGRSLEVIHEEPRAGDVLHSQADQSKLRELFPDIQPVDLETGLRATVDWFRTSGALST